MKLSLTASVVSKADTQVKRLEMLESMFSQEERIHCTTHPKPITFSTQSRSKIYTFAALPFQISAATCGRKGTRFVPCGKQTFKEENTGLQSQGSELCCMLLWKRYSEDKINVSYNSFITLPLLTTTAF